MATCKTCKWWDKKSQVCDMLDSGTTVYESPTLFEIVVRVADDTDLNVKVRTGPDFGCVHHTPGGDTPTLSLYAFEGTGHQVPLDYATVVAVVCGESKAEGLALVRAANRGVNFEDDNEDKLPVVIDQNTPKGVVHQTTVYTS